MCVSFHVFVCGVFDCKVLRVHVQKCVENQPKTLSFILQCQRADVGVFAPRQGKIIIILLFVYTLTHARGTHRQSLK